MWRIVKAIALGMGLLLSAASTAAAALTPTITSYPASIPVSPESHPYAIAAGADGQLWFTDPYAHQIGRMTVDGTLTLQAPSPTFQYAITAGSDGAMWFVSQNPSSVSRIDGAGEILTRNLASATANPTHMTSGPDGAIWFTESAGKAIGRIPAAAPLAEPEEWRSTPEGPDAIASGSDGNIWFTEYTAHMVVRMAANGESSFFPMPVEMQNPMGIAAGPDGALWVTASNPPAVIRFATDGSSRSIPLPHDPFPGEITAGPDGALWIAAFDTVDRVTTDGAVESFSLPAETGAKGITAGPDGNVWFAEEGAGGIGRITTPPNATTGGAADIEAGRATISGSVNGHSQPLDVAIEYGSGAGATATSSKTHFDASANDQQVSIRLSGLAPRTTYRYRVAATNPTGTTEGAFGELTTTSGPSCRVSRTKTGPGGTLILKLACKATSSVGATATAPKAHRSPRRRASAQRKRPALLLYGKAHARVKKGRATLRIKPRKAARAQLRRHHRLRVNITMKLHGGGATTVLKKRVRARR